MSKEVYVGGVVRKAKACKVWDASRTSRKAVVVHSLEELRTKGRQKLGWTETQELKILLEVDGTLVDDEEYFACLPDNTVFLFIRAGDAWVPPSRFLRPIGGGHPIPQVVVDTLGLLELHEESTFWKLIDNKGRITLVLHWEPPRVNHPPRVVESTIGRDRSRSTPLDMKLKLLQKEGFAHTTITGGKMETLINHVNPPMAANPSGGNSSVPGGTPSVKPPAITVRMASQESNASGSSRYSSTHVSSSSRQTPITDPGTGGGGSDHTRRPCPNTGNAECDFHCCSLHEEGRSIRDSTAKDAGATGGGGERKLSQKDIHVRFQEDAHARASSSGETQPRFAHDVTPRRRAAARDSSESDGDQESNPLEDEVDSEGTATEKLLLLTDQLTLEQKRHLTVLDLGVILDRLKAKIIDVDRLEREKEGPGCFRWTIKATIRGEYLRDLGILYNGSYYSISEHPGLEVLGNGEDDEDEDREDPV